MSVSYRAYVVWGFEIEVVDVKKKMTKYNEDTGKPYEVEIISHKVALDKETKKPLISTEKNPDALHLEYAGMSFHGTGTDMHALVLGKRVISLGEYGEDQYHGVVTGEIPTDVSAAAEKHGLTPRLHALFYISY